MELLAPAGGMDSLIAAVQNGADAVYFGGGAFSARRFAKNFDNEELQRALDYCHVRGVKAYITFNTLIFDRELEKALDYAAFLYQAGADALIVQDIGLISILKSQLPDMPLHASTQMGIHDEGGVRLVKRLGFECAVLSRETPVSRIKQIRKSVEGIRLEAFAHGALCMSFSGGCLFSSMAGERSGNRGTCAQPCRKRMAVEGLPGNRDYALSLGDICLLEHLPQLKEAGVDSIKLEGRMKRAEYVALVTAAYRAALSGEPVDINEFTGRQRGVFYRGFTTGHMFGDGGSTGWVAAQDGDNAVLKGIQAALTSERRKRGVAMELTLLADAPARLTLSCGGATVSAEGEAAQPAIKAPDAGRYAAQLQKLGDTPFYCESCDVRAEAFLPVAAVNSLRRQAVDKLKEELALIGRRKSAAPKLPMLPNFPNAQKPKKLVAVVRNAAQAGAAAGNCDYLALDFCRLEPGQFAGLPGQKLLLYLPPVMISGEERKKAEALLASGVFCGGIANNLGQLELLCRDGLEVCIAGAHINAFNSAAVAALKEWGCSDVQLSLELTRPQLRDILQGVGGGISVYGRAPLMLLRHCPVKEYQGCRGCEGIAGNLTDEAGRRFPLINNRQQDGCLVTVQNCEITDVTDVCFDLPADFLLLTFTEETPEQVIKKLNDIKSGLSGKAVPVVAGTRGHWNRAVE